VRNGHGDAAFGGSVKLGQHDPIHAGNVHELAGLGQAILPDRRVENEQHLVWRAFDFACSHTSNLVELVHQIGTRVQAAGGIHEHNVPLPRFARSDGV